MSSSYQEYSYSTSGSTGLQSGVRSSSGNQFQTGQAVINTFQAQDQYQGGQAVINTFKAQDQYQGGQAVINT